MTSVHFAWHFTSDFREVSFVRLSRGVNAEGVFCSAPRDLNIIGEHLEKKERLAPAQASVQKFESEVLHLCKANTKAASLRGVVARFPGKFANAPEQGEHDSAAPQTLANADQDMLHAALWECTRVQSLLEAERQERQTVERLITRVLKLVGLNSSLVDSAGPYAHSDMHHVHEMCLR